MPGCYRIFISSLAFVLIFAFIADVNAGADKVGTVLAKNGERYENVVIKINHFYKVLKFKYRGKKINISFNDIEAVYDRHGNDISTYMLGRFYRPSEETRISREWKITAKSHEKVWRAIFGLHVNYSIPNGKYFGGLRPSFGYGGDIHLAFTHKIAGRFLVSKSGLKIDEIYRPYLYNSNYYVVDQDNNISIVMYIAAVEYYGHFDRKKNDYSLWYLSGGLGAASQNRSTIASIRINPVSPVTYYRESIVETKFAFYLGFGIIKSFNKRIGLSFDGDLYFVRAGDGPSSFSNDRSNFAYILDFKIGIASFY